MKNIVVFGYAFEGAKIYTELEKSKEYHMMGFADNSPFKHGYIAAGFTIKSMDELEMLNKEIPVSVIIASRAWEEIGAELKKRQIPIEGFVLNLKLHPYHQMTFEQLDFTKPIKFYAGDICDEIHQSDPDLYGLSIRKADRKHILHSVTEPYPLPDNCIESYQAEDVLEHCELRSVIPALNEIYRILKKDGMLRISLPDYSSPYLKDISMKDENGTIIFDATGGGILDSNGVNGGGHVWFPTFPLVKDLLEKTDFDRVVFRCYHTEDEMLIREDIDYADGYLRRVPEKCSEDQVIFSMVIDCYKE